MAEKIEVGSDGPRWGLKKNESCRSTARRIAIFLPNLVAGGAERAALSLVRGFVDRGFDVDLVLLQRSGELLEIVPPKVRIIDLGATSIYRAFAPLVLYLRRERPIALQVHLWPLTILGILASRFAAGVRVVVVDHAPLSHQFKSVKMSTALRLTTRFLYPRASARVVVSNGVADDLSAVSGIKATDVRVIFNPVELQPRASSPEEIEELWAGCRNRIVTAAVLKPEKNHRLLISAFADLRQKMPAKLMIVGDGPSLADTRAHAAREGVADDVIFTGFQLDPTPYLSSATVFALSSDFEGFGLVLIEALGLGLSIVSTDCPSGPREILAGGRYGKLVPPGDRQGFAVALCDALRNVPDHETLRERAEELSGSHVIDDHLALLTGAEGHEIQRTSTLSPEMAALMVMRHVDLQSPGH